MSSNCRGTVKKISTKSKKIGNKRKNKRKRKKVNRDQEEEENLFMKWIGDY